MSNIIEGITKDLKAIPKNLKAKVGGMDTKKLVLLNLPYIFVGYFCDKVAWMWRVSEGTNASDKMMAVMNRFDKLFANPLPSFHPRDLLIGVAGGIALRLVVYYKAKNAKKFRQGVEYGSARWGNAKDIEPYMDSVFENNVLLTQTERLMMSGRPKEPKYARNKNILVIGGSGSGKTRFFVKPNLMQMHSSYVVTDPKGTVLVECGKMLKRGKYKIKVLNTINFAKSMHYNPFAYLRSEKDILKLVNTIIVNTKGEGQQSGEDFWVKAEKLYYTALIAYIWYEAPEEEQNFAMLIDMIDASEAREDDENFKNAVDLLFEELEADKPNHFAVRQYKKYKLAAGKTAKSILISCGARLAPFDIKELRDLMEYDELELDKLGDEKSALFFLISDTDTTYNFLVALAFSQMFNLLCERADNTYGGRLPYHVRVLWDEAANTGQVPGLEKIVAVIRSREISLTLFYQAMSQCKALYKDHSETIMGNMDSIVFLGGREASTLKDISENWLGKATISMQTEGRSRGQSESYSQNMQRLGRELMTTSEITTMPGDKCILQLRGLPPFLSPKYDLKKHPNYKYTAEFDKKKNAFRLESLFRHRPLRLKPEDEYTVYEVDGSDTDEEADLLNFDDLDSDEFV